MFMCVAWRLTVDSRSVFGQIMLEHMTVVFKSVKVDSGVISVGPSLVIDIQEVIYHRGQVRSEVWNSALLTCNR
jgi:hypothetical protein